MHVSVRMVVKDDVSSLQKVVDSCGLFPSYQLDGLLSDYFERPDTEDVWFTALAENVPVAVGYCAPETFTDGTCNLYAIGVLEHLQGHGIGTAMMQFLETVLAEKKKRVLIVETSGTESFRRTRDFYQKLGYRHEATIRDFWKDGDDKVIFWKKLSAV